MLSNLAISSLTYVGFAVLAIITLVIIGFIVKTKRRLIGLPLVLMVLIVFSDIGGSIALVKWNSNQFIPGSSGLKKTSSNYCILLNQDCQSASHSTQEQVISSAIEGKLYIDAQKYLESLPLQLQKQTMYGHLKGTESPPSLFYLSWTGTILSNEYMIFGHIHFSPLRQYSLNIPSWIGYCHIYLTVPFNDLSNSPAKTSVYLVSNGTKKLLNYALFAQYASNKSCVTSKVLDMSFPAWKKLDYGNNSLIRFN